MAVAGILKVLIDADTKKFDKGMVSIGKRLNALGPEVARFGAILAAAVGAGLVASVVKAAAFEKQMSKVGSLLGNMEKKVLPKFTKGVQALSVQTGQSVDSLSTALFDLVSAGMETDKAMKILAESAKLAVGGFTTTDAATQALITTMQTFKGEIRDAADASDFLFAVQKGGRLTVEQVASSIGSFAAVGKAAGVSATDLGAAFASISLAGEGAETASTQLRSILITLQKDSEGMTKTAKGMGLEIDFAKIQTEGLIPWLQQFSDLTGSQIAKLFKESRALRGMNTMLANLNEVQKRVNITTDRAGASADAYARRQEEMTVQWDKLIQRLAQFTRDIGEGLLPTVKELVNYVLANKDSIIKFSVDLSAWLKSYIQDLRTIFTWVQENKKFADKMWLSVKRMMSAIPGMGAALRPDLLTDTLIMQGGRLGHEAAPGLRSPSAIPGPGPFMGPMPAPAPAGAGGGAAGGGGMTSPLGSLGLFGMDNDILGSGGLAAILESVELQAAESAGAFQQTWDDAFGMVFESSTTLFDGLTALMTGMTDTLSSTFNEIFVGLAEGTANFSEIMQSLITGMRDMFFKVAADMLARWVMTLLMKKVKSMAMWVWERGMQTTAAATDVATHTAAATAKIAANTAVAQSGVVAAHAGIPFVGIAIGLAAAAAIVGIMAGFSAFADGGIVTKPTLGLVGEAGPEAIIPLDKAGGLGGGEVHIHISGEFIEGDEASWDDLVRSKIVPALQAYNAKGLGGIA